MFHEFYFPPVGSFAAPLAEIMEGVPFCLSWEGGRPRLTFLVKWLSSFQLLALLSVFRPRHPVTSCDKCWGRQELYRLFGVADPPDDVVDTVLFLRDYYDADPYLVEAPIWRMDVVESQFFQELEVSSFSQHFSFSFGKQFDDISYRFFCIVRKSRFIRQRWRLVPIA